MWIVGHVYFDWESEVGSPTSRDRFARLLKSDFSFLQTLVFYEVVEKIWWTSDERLHHHS
jgi:hypothetical protein